jgi:hypothetical protein
LKPVADAKMKPDIGLVLYEKFVVLMAKKPHHLKINSVEL